MPSQLAVLIVATTLLFSHAFVICPFPVSKRLLPSSDLFGSSDSDDFDEEEDIDMVVDWDWEKMVNDVFFEDKRSIVLFDGVCNLCNGGVNFAIDQGNYFV